MGKLNVFERSAMWIFSSSWRIVGCWIVLIVLAYFLLYLTMGSKQDLVVVSTLIALPLMTLDRFYGGIAGNFYKIEKKLSAMENLAAKPETANMALSPLWDICKGYEPRFESFFTEELYGRAFYDRFMAIVEKLKNSPENLLPGVRMIDFVDALDDVTEMLEDRKDEQGLGTYQIRLQNDLEAVSAWLVEKRLKPREKFFMEDLGADPTFLKYSKSMLWRYHRLVFPFEEHCKIIAGYFERADKSALLEIFAVAMTDSGVLDDLFDYLKPLYPEYLATTESVELSPEETEDEE